VTLDPRGRRRRRTLDAVPPLPHPRRARPRGRRRRALRHRHRRIAAAAPRRLRGVPRPPRRATGAGPRDRPRVLPAFYARCATASPAALPSPSGWAAAWPPCCCASARPSAHSRTSPN